MSRSVLYCLLLAGFFTIQAMANRSDQPDLNPTIRVADPPLDGAELSPGAAAPEIRRLGKHHSSSDKSVAGGGVIIGGLATAIFAAVFCYIRVTRKRIDHH